MQRPEISGGQTSSQTVPGRKVTTHEGFDHITGSLSQLPGSSAWSMNKPAGYMINNECMNDFTDKLINACAAPDAQEERQSVLKSIRSNSMHFNFRDGDASAGGGVASEDGFDDFSVGEEEESLIYWLFNHKVT